jgi:hypothetical protein
MATSKGKRGIKKSAKMKKGKALQPVKPLAVQPLEGGESMSIPYGTFKYTYTR